MLVREVPLLSVAGWDVAVRFLGDEFAHVHFRQGETRLWARLVMPAMQFIDSPPPLTQDQVTEIWQAIQRNKEHILTPETYPRFRDQLIREALPSKHPFFVRTGDGWSSGHVYIYSSQVIPKESRAAIVAAFEANEMCGFTGGDGNWKPTVFFRLHQEME